MKRFTWLTNCPIGAQEAILKPSASGGVLELRCQWNAQARQQLPENLKYSIPVGRVDINAAEFDGPSTVWQSVPEQ